jgi:hypothetical protein
MGETKQIFQTVAKELESNAEAIDYGAPASFFPEEETDDTKEPAAKLEDKGGELQGSFTLKSRDQLDWDCWGNGALFDIPHLLPEQLGTVPEPITTWLGPLDTEPCENFLYVWGSTALEHTGPNVVPCFYTADERFDPVWVEPEVYTANLLRYGVKTIISPNFSCYDGAHKAEDIWQTYRARWLSRYFQESGLRVIPDIMLGGLANGDDVWQWRFAGIPKGCPAVSLQVQQKGGAAAQPELFYRQRHRQLLRVLDLLRPESLLLYRGPDLPDWFVARLPKTLHVVECNSFMSGRSAVMKAKRERSISLKAAPSTT